MNKASKTYEYKRKKKKNTPKHMKSIPLGLEHVGFLLVASAPGMEDKIQIC